MEDDKDSARIDSREVNPFDRFDGATSFPVCMVSAFDLTGELPDLPAAEPDTHAWFRRETKKVFGVDRTCDEWIEFRPGETPRGGLRRRDEMRQDRFNAMYQRRLLILTVATAGVAVAALIAALLPLAYPDGIGYFVDHTPGQAQSRP
ncbi:MAG: hypothetical protein WEB52_09945 [Dehalococcoidia bacterium]